MAKRVSLKGRGADLFFGDYAPPGESDGDPGAASGPDALRASETVALSTLDAARPAGAPVVPETTQAARAKRPNARGSRAGTDGSPASNLASKLASSRPVDATDVVEAIRRVVKTPGREVSFVRLTPEEKAQLGDVVYTYKRQGMKTTETEVNRIALNYLLHDYREHGEHSVLARVLAALLA
jgi:hypothetical protein